MQNGGGYKNNYNKPRRPRVDFTADVGVGRQYTSFEFGQPQPGYNFGGYSYGYPQPRYQGGGYRKYNQNPTNRAPPPPLALPEVELFIFLFFFLFKRRDFQVADVPLDVDTDDYKVDQAEMICFFGKEHFLSNMHIVSQTSVEFLQKYATSGALHPGRHRVSQHRALLPGQ